MGKVERLLLHVFNQVELVLDRFVGLGARIRYVESLLAISVLDGCCFGLLLVPTLVKAESGALGELAA